MNKELLTTGEMKELNEGRAVMYKLLASVYKIEANEEFLDNLLNLARIKTNTEDEFTSDYKTLANYLAQDFSQNEISREDELAVDYAKLFLGIGRNQTNNAFPYESVYTSSKGVLMQEAMEEVTKVYDEHRFEVKGDVDVSADHLYIELEFMSSLCSATADKDDNMDEVYKVQLDFITNHLKNWVSRFCSDVKSFADTDYYKALASITNKFIDLDHKVLKSIL